MTCQVEERIQAEVRKRVQEAVELAVEEQQAAMKEALASQMEARALEIKTEDLENQNLLVRSSVSAAVHTERCSFEVGARFTVLCNVHVFAQEPPRWKKSFVRLRWRDALRLMFLGVGVKF